MPDCRFSRRRAALQAQDPAQHWASMLGERWSPFVTLPNKAFPQPAWLDERMLAVARRRAWIRVLPTGKLRLLPRGRSLRRAIRQRTTVRRSFNDSPYEDRKP